MHVWLQESNKGCLHSPVSSLPSLVPPPFYLSTDADGKQWICPLLESLWWYCLNIKAASDMSWVNNSLCRGMILTQQNTLRLHAGRGFQSQWLNSRLASWLRRHLHPCDSNFICPQLSSYCLMQLYRNEVLLIQQETYSCLLGSKPLPLMTAHSFLLSDIQTADMVSKDERKI